MQVNNLGTTRSRTAIPFEAVLIDYLLYPLSALAGERVYLVTERLFGLLGKAKQPGNVAQLKIGAPDHPTPGLS